MNHPLYDLGQFAIILSLGVLQWVAIIIVLVAGWRRKFGGGETALVVQEWRADNSPDDAGRFVFIRGRHAGMWAWLRSTLKLDDDVSLAVLEGRVEFGEHSLAGSKRRLIPLSSISSTEYGFHRPWKVALLWFVFVEQLTVFLMTLSGSGPIASSLTGSALGLVVALVYYLLNRGLRLGFREHGNQFTGVQFRRSIIENQEISEEQAGYVCVLVQILIENDRIQGGGVASMTTIP